MEAQTKYARNGDVLIAYRVFGEGPRDIILVPGTISHVELFWELPVNEYLLRRLAAFARVIIFDKRGQGLSDRVAEQSLEERVSDVEAVMDAAGSARATVYGWSEGGPMSIKLASTHPERVTKLVIYGSYASIKGPPWSVTVENYDKFLAPIGAHWGEGILVGQNSPGRVRDKTYIQWFGRLERAVASPSSILALMRANYHNDVRELLPSLRLPTLILHRVGDLVVPVDCGRYLARKIPGAKYIELPGDDHTIQSMDQDVLDLLLDAVEEFITGECHRPRPGEIFATPLTPDMIFAPRPGSSESASGKYDSADEALAELQRCREILASGEDGPGLVGLIARAEAIAAAARGSWTESEAQFIKAAETFRRHGMVWQEAKTFQSWGTALRDGVDRKAALEKLDAAIEIYRRQGAASVASEMNHLGDANGADASRASGNGATTSPAAMFKREGDYWTISMLGNAVRIRDAKGLHYVAYLLANPSRRFAAAELAAAGTANGDLSRANVPGLTPSDLGDAGAILDAKARAQYRRRIAELREEVAEAVRNNDLGHAELRRSEMETLRDQLAAAVGLGGRSRKAASHSERARLMVTKAIKAAIAKIRTSDPSLGRYLATSIKTGNFCAYEPDPVQPVSWQL